MFISKLFYYLATLTSFYMLILSVYIFLSWFQVFGKLSKMYTFFYRLANPYLRLFRGIKGLRFGMFDFSPVLGFITLTLLNQGFYTIANQGIISLGSLLFIVLTYLWKMSRFLFILFLLSQVLRLVSLTILPHWGSSHLWKTVDNLTRTFYRKFTIHWQKNHIPRYSTLLIINSFTILIYLFIFYYFYSYIGLLISGI